MHKDKPYGISIPGCIDGYSRHTILLEVAAWNKVPRLIAKHYLDAIKQMEGAFCDSSTACLF